MESLATKYRPRSFSEVAGQKYIIDILQRQLRLRGTISNCYLFAGPTGTGKTTLARIFANEINNGCGTPIEIDAASNNGVDNIRAITEESQLRSLDSEYRIYIIDEVHMITREGWNAFLKTLEEPTATTIFILCTTEPNKIPATILNRVMRFNLSKVPSEEIYNRLVYICMSEGFTNYEETCDYISKACQGGMRDAIAMLDICSKHSSELDVEYAQISNGCVPFDKMIDLTNLIIDGAEAGVLATLDKIYNEGYDLKVFVDQYLDFILDLVKYCATKNIGTTKFPAYLEELRDPFNHEVIPGCIKYVTGIQDNVKYFNEMSRKLLDLKFKIKYNTSVRTTVGVFFTSILVNDGKAV